MRRFEQQIAILRRSKFTREGDLSTQALSLHGASTHEADAYLVHLQIRQKTFFGPGLEEAVDLIMEPRSVANPIRQTVENRTFVEAACLACSVEARFEIIFITGCCHRDDTWHHVQIASFGIAVSDSYEVSAEPWSVQ